MGLFRLLVIFIVGYFLVRLLKLIFLPKTQDKGVRGDSEPNHPKKYKNIEDADYEEVD